MFLIADCGSTKCDWAVSNGDEDVKFFSGVGFNAIHSKDEVILLAIKNAISSNGIDTKSIDKIYFYGAGCIEGIGAEKVSYTLKYFFQNSEIYTFDDLTGAGRAIFKTDPGIACILGTGCNSGVYNNFEIGDHIYPMGYIIGDEGSGASIGKRLVNAIYKKELPDTYRNLFEKECMMSYDDVIYGVYRSDTPAVFLASLVPFIHEHINDPIFRNLVFCEFDLFFNHNIIRLDRPKNYSAGFVGSIASYFGDILRDAARFHGITISSIIQRPIQRLVEFHNEVSL
ncbi:MAG: ATPase [Bacteroidales bacterium]|nr:ATPase [Bacteroidales bacterium]